MVREELVAWVVVVVEAEEEDMEAGVEAGVLVEEEAPSSPPIRGRLGEGGTTNTARPEADLRLRLQV